MNNEKFREIKDQLLDIRKKKISFECELYRLSTQQRIKNSLSGMTNNGWVTIYTNEVPYELDTLRTNLYQKTDLGFLIQTVLGTGLNNPLLAAGFPCSPISPPGLSVTVGPGIIYKFDFLIPNAWSVIPQDINPDHRIYKSYINFDTQTFSTPAPVTAGNSIIYLIQGVPEEKDVNVVSRPYFNSADPQSPIYESQSDTRLDFTQLGIKPGVESPSPTPPTPDAGYTALYYVTVAYGQTSITSGDIAVVPGSPFITESLTQKISAVTGVTTAALQNNTTTFVSDIGTVNTLVANATPAYSAPVSGQRIFVQAGNTITGSATLNVNGHGSVLICGDKLSTLCAGEIVSGNIYEFIYNSTVPCWQLINPTKIALVSQVSLSAGTVTAGSVVVAFNTVDFDNFSLFDGATKLTPNRAGNWNIYANFATQGVGSNPTISSPEIYFNGIPYKFGSFGIPSAGGTGGSATVMCGKYFNGSSDYVQVYLQSVYNGYIIGGINQNYFGIQYIGD